MEISQKINITLILLSKGSTHKMDCKYCHNIYSGVHVGLSVYLWWFASVRILGKVGEFVEDWRVATMWKSTRIL